MMGGPSGRPDGREPLWHRFVEWTGLAAVLLFLATLVAPAHWTSIWMDRDFTGYVAPIANRIAAGQRLYEEGARLPIPPVSFVLLRIVSGGQATWLWESVTNAVAQSLILSTLYAGLSRHFRSPLPLLAILAAAPIFFSLQKTILYDALAQWLAALGIVAAAGFLLGAPREDRGSAALPFLAVVAALCFLTKQSTGAGLIGGTALALLVLLPGSAGARAAVTAKYGLFVLLALVAGALALSPFVSVTGMLEDAVLSGSEPKGGLATMLSYLPAYARQIRLPLIGAGVFTIGWLLVGPRTEGMVAEGGRRGEITWGAAARLVLYLALGAAITTTIVLLLASADRVTARRLLTLVGTTWSFPVLYGGVLPLGLMLSLSYACLSCIRPDSLPPAVRTLGAFALIASPVAVAHSLSVPFFRWTYENNPLIVVALACVLAPPCAWWRRISFPSVGWGGMLVGALLFVTTAWTVLHPQIDVIHRCTETWGEIRHLAGARLRPRADGMRQVVHIVRKLAPEPTDRVLLLPEDPNVHEWFERPRPRLSSAIVFSEAYWDRYVDSDFARLASDPPKVLVIGPEPHWRTFHRLWNPNRGAERLIDRVEAELLPARYRLARVVSIRMANLHQDMRVFVRVDGGGPGPMP